MRYWLLFLFLGISISNWSQDHIVNVQHLSMKDGLSHYKVLSFLSGTNGMWIGTEDGLNFFDGFNWQYWKKEDQQLHFKEVDRILRDQENNLWLLNINHVGARNEFRAVDILSPGASQAKNLKDFFYNSLPFSLKSITQFFTDTENRIYIFADDQLWRYSTGTSFELISSFPKFEPLKFFADGTSIGILDERLAILSSTNELILHTDYTINKNTISIEGTQQKFLVSQPDNNLIQLARTPEGLYQSGTFLPEHGNDKLNPKLNINVVAHQKKDDRYWIYIEPKLYLFDALGNTILQHNIEPRSACIDDHGNLWVGNSGVDILKIQTQRFRRYLHQNSNNTELHERFRCRGLVEKDSFLYVNTYHHTKKINLKTGVYTDFPFSDSKRKFVVIKNKQQQLLFANRKVFKLDIDKSIPQKIYSHEDSEPDRIWSMIEDTNGRIWVGDEGISYIDKQQIKDFRQYNEYDRLTKATVLAFYKDKNGVIWVASNEGLYILDPERGITNGFGKYWENKSYLPTNKFQHIYQDSEGIFWLATEDTGLIRWDKTTGQWVVFNKKNGFLSNNIYAVYEDDYDFLWLSSFNGLIRFNKNNYQVTVFTEEDGITCNEFNRISHLKTNDGQLFFGSQNGITAIHPKDFLKEQNATKQLQLKINHLAVYGKDIMTDTLETGAPINLYDLASSTKVINLEIAFSDFFWSKQVELHYSLETISNNRFKKSSKENISTDNHIELFDMTPGEYVLRIKAKQKNGKQLGETLQIPLKINIPITQTYSFWFGLILILGLSTGFFIKYRTARLQKRKVELEVLVEKRTQEVLTNQKTILSQAEQIAVMQEKLNQKDERWLAELRTIINERLEDSNLDLPAIIDNMDIGRTQFFAKVKTLTNMTPNQYVQELRLTKAKNILDAGKVKTVKEVAYAVGIRRPGYFSKLFKDRFGILPSEYFRRNNN